MGRCLGGGDSGVLPARGRGGKPCVWRERARGSREHQERLEALVAVSCEGEGVRWEGGIAEWCCVKGGERRGKPWQEWVLPARGRGGMDEGGGECRREIRTEIVACGMEMGCRGSRRGLDRLEALVAVSCRGNGVRWEGGIAEWCCVKGGERRGKPWQEWCSRRGAGSAWAKEVLKVGETVVESRRSSAATSP